MGGEWQVEVRVRCGIEKALLYAQGARRGRGGWAERKQDSGGLLAGYGGVQPPAGRRGPVTGRPWEPELLVKMEGVKKPRQLFFRMGESPFQILKAGAHSL